MNYTYADTKCGRLRGVLQDNSDGSQVHVFKGVPYAAPPVGELRFRHPAPPLPWEGTRDAIEFGNRAIQGAAPFKDPEPQYMKYNAERERMRATAKPYKPAPQSEDCLFLNVWTPAVGDGKKRAVMVWCHGGGYTNGSGDRPWYDGSNLAAHEDVVVITFNHRLAVWGYFYLADCEDKSYANDVNAGLMDMTAVLRWIHDNIEAFGGDPDNVLVFGQSGGGQKVCAIACMPSCKGLVHKGISMSGGFFTLPLEPMKQISHEILDKLGVPTTDLSALATLPAEVIQKAYVEVIEVHKEGADFGACLDPVADGTVIPCSPFDEDFGKINPEFVFMSGTTKDDGRLECSLEGRLYEINTPETVQAEMVRLHLPAEYAAQAYADYMKQLPAGSEPNDVLCAYLTDIRFRQAAIKQAELRAKLPECAPVYMYSFDWDCPSKQEKAFHGEENAFLFRNLENAPGLTTNPADGHELLQDLYSGALANFAKTGDPNFPGLPAWHPYDLTTRATMVFDTVCHEEQDPGKAGRELMDKVTYVK